MAPERGNRIYDQNAFSDKLFANAPTTISHCTIDDGRKCRRKNCREHVRCGIKQCFHADHLPHELETGDEGQRHRRSLRSVVAGNGPRQVALLVTFYLLAAHCCGTFVRCRFKQDEKAVETRTFLRR